MMCPVGDQLAGRSDPGCLGRPLRDGETGPATKNDPMWFPCRIDNGPSMPAVVVLSRPHEIITGACSRSPAPIFEVVLG